MELDRLFEKPPSFAVVEEKLREILQKGDPRSQASLRFSLVADLASWGEPAIPALEKTLEGGNLERKRLAVFALSRLRSESSLLRVGAERREIEIECLALLAGGRAGHRESLDKALAALQSKLTDPYLKLAAAFAWAGAPERMADRSQLDSLLAFWKTEDNPELAGALAIAVGKQGGESSFAPLLSRLAISKDPVLRTGVWLGFAAAGGVAPWESALADAALHDPVLSPAAALSLAEFPEGSAQERWEKCYRLAERPLRSALLEGLARSSDSRARGILLDAALGERDPETRRASLRAALHRHDFPLALALRKNRAGEELGGPWALVMALLHLERRPGSESLDPSLRAQKETSALPSQDMPQGWLYWIGAAGARDSEPWLKTLELQGGELSDTARCVRKYLRGELDSRAFLGEARRLATAENLLPGYSLQRAQVLYAQALLGGGSTYFEGKKTPYPGGSGKGEKRKSRPIALDSSFFEDLWHWLESDWLVR